VAAPRTEMLTSEQLGKRLRSLAAVELLLDCLALNTRIVFYPVWFMGRLQSFKASFDE